MIFIENRRDHVPEDPQPASDRPPCSTPQSVRAWENLSRRTFLDGMRQVAAAVTVVTTDGPAGRYGATVSAFTSVSADPPTVLVCLRSSSRICAAVRLNGVFTVSALTAAHEELARSFAGEFDTTISDRFSDVPLEPFDDFAPGIAGASCFACSTVKMLEQHTHTIVIGRVARVAIVRASPLLYHDAAYGQLVRGNGEVAL